MVRSSVCKPQADGKWLCERADLTNVDTTALGFLQQSLIPMGSETHGGEDVAIFASGPGANLFSGRGRAERDLPRHGAQPRSGEVV